MKLPCARLVLRACLVPRACLAPAPWLAPAPSLALHVSSLASRAMPPAFRESTVLWVTRSAAGRVSPSRHPPPPPLRSSSRLSTAAQPPMSHQGRGVVAVGDEA